MKSKIIYLLRRTLNELIISIVQLVDFLLFDLTLFSPIRSLIWRLVAKIGKWTRIRKWLFVTNIWKLKIGKNCFINRNNLFDNNKLIIIWDDCSLGYDNKFITSSHYEKQNIKENIKFTTYSEGITIWNNVWITSGCIILPWTVIENDVILAANSVAKWLLEENYVYAWSPAKKIRKTQWFISKNM